MTFMTGVSAFCNHIPDRILQSQTLRYKNIQDIFRELQ